jgi:LysM repeat protein
MQAAIKMLFQQVYLSLGVGDMQMKKMQPVWLVFLNLSLVILILRPTGVLGQTLPAFAYIDGVRGYPQTYSLSCESRSAADWAAFWGYRVSEVEFLFNLPVSDNPDEGFVGDPNGPWGYTPPKPYGVHAEPVAALLREYGLEAEARRGMTWDEARAEIAAGRPLIVWIIGAMWNGTPLIYTALDGKTTTVARYEHAMILIGYDSQYVRVVDSASGKTQTYTVHAFRTSWAVLGNMAVVGKGDKLDDPTPTPPESIYIVQKGDTLYSIAIRFQIAWQELAAYNGINYPYTIFPGQALKIPGIITLPNPPDPTADYQIALPLIVLNPQPAEGQTWNGVYIVKQGDYLIALAKHFNVDWRTLASMNGIRYPYVLYPGQVLKVPG